jgi:hypothetical protein
VKGVAFNLLKGVVARRHGEATPNLAEQHLGSAA